MSSERRGDVRFLPQDIAFVALRDRFKTVGKITDISIDGLSFKYIGKDIPKETFSHIDIFMLENEFHLYNVLCRIIHEISDHAIDKDFFVRKFRCGLQFGGLKKSQSEQLKLFIEKHTTGTLESSQSSEAGAWKPEYANLKAKSSSTLSQRPVPDGNGSGRPMPVKDQPIKFTLLAQ